MSENIQKKRGLFAARDFTQGSILKGMVAFSIPLLIGNIFQQLYNTVDALVVGQALGMEALAAVGASAMVVFFFISLFIGLSIGAGVVISQAFGARNMERLEKAVSTTYGCTIVIGALISVAGYFLAEPLLRLLQTPQEIMADATTYLRIIFIGMLALAVYNTLGGVLRAVGDSITPLIFLIVATILNTVLDLLFVLGFGWGIASVAYATITSQAVSALLCIIRIRYMRSELHVTPRHLKIHRDILPEVLRIGLPASVQQVAISLGSMVIQGLVNTLGVSTVAGWVAFMRIDPFTTMPMMTISTAVSTFVGQNIGARNMERVEKGIKTSLVLVIGAAIAMSAATLLFARPLIAAFIPGDTPAVQEAVQAGIDIVWRIVPFYFLLGIQFTLNSVLRGAGEAKIPMFTSILSVVIIRMPLAYLFYYLFKTPSAIWWSTAISWGVGLSINLTYYYRAKWRTRAIERVERMYAPTAEPVDLTEG